MPDDRECVIYLGEERKTDRGVWGREEERKSDVRRGKAEGE